MLTVRLGASKSSIQTMTTYVYFIIKPPGLVALSRGTGLDCDPDGEPSL